MSIQELLEDETTRIEHLLETVPFTSGRKSTGYFLGIYKLAYSDIKNLNTDEVVWSEHHLPPAAKLFRLGVALGNLLRRFLFEKNIQETRKSPLIPRSALGDPFTEGPALPLAAYQLNFTRNMAGILRTFDVNILALVGGPGGSEHTLNSLPIQVGSRQLLVEKIDVTIPLDSLFTVRVLLRLLGRIIAILQEPLAGYIPDPAGPQTKTTSLSSSIFLAGSNLHAEPITLMDDYARTVADIVRRVDDGLISPFMAMVNLEVVEPHVMDGFKDLIATI